MTIYGGKLDRPRKLNFIDQIKFFRRSFNPLRNLLIKYYLRNVDQVFSVSESLAQALAINGIKKVTVVHNGVDPEDWVISPAESDSFRQKNNLVDKKIVLFGGRLSGPKGGEAIVKILSLVVKRVPTAILLVAGQEDGYAEKLKGLAAGLGVDNHIIWLGWVGRGEMKLAYGVADVVVVPSLYLDPFPTVNLEAMAAGKPVVGTIHGGTPEVVVDGETGYVVDPIDQMAFSAKLVELLGNTEIASRFGQAGKERIKNILNLKKQLEVTKEWYGRKN
jgi:glycosyltransferase involved in cell wall biosynthesis